MAPCQHRVLERTNEDHCPVGSISSLCEEPVVICAVLFSRAVFTVIVPYVPDGQQGLMRQEGPLWRRAILPRWMIPGVLVTSSDRRQLATA